MMDKKSMLAIGQSIKSYRNKAKLTQLELSRKIEKTESTVRKYEAGTVLPPLDVIEDISKILGITPFDLMGAGYWDLTIGEAGLKKLRDEVTLIEGIEKAYGSGAAELLESFSQLNTKGKEKALDSLSDLTMIEQYTKKD